MGNHEFCVDCHENDFHIGRPCDPEKVAKVQAEKREREDSMRAKREASSQLIAMGVEGTIDEYGNLVVRNPGDLLIRLMLGEM